MGVRLLWFIPTQPGYSPAPPYGGPLQQVGWGAVGSDLFCCCWWRAAVLCEPSQLLLVSGRAAAENDFLHNMIRKAVEGKDINHKGQGSRTPPTTQETCSSHGLRLCSCVQRGLWLQLSWQSGSALWGGITHPRTLQGCAP